MPEPEPIVVVVGVGQRLTVHWQRTNCAPTETHEFIGPPEDVDMRDFVRIGEALDVARGFGTPDEAHHAAWVIDQMVRNLTGDSYEEWIRLAKLGDNGPDTYGWNEGIPP